MPFKNEFVPTLDRQLESCFFASARTTLRVGHIKYDRWTIDHERELVLKHSGSGRELESAKQDYWEFIDCKGRYDFTTEELSRVVFVSTDPRQGTGAPIPQDFWEFIRLEDRDLAQAEVAITYKLLRFWGGNGCSLPDLDSILCIKQALCEYGRWWLFEPDALRGCQVTLIDGSTGKEY